MPISHIHPCLQPFDLRLCLWIVLGMAPGSIVTMGCDCSSWTVPARGTSMRNYINAHGNIFLRWVRSSNSMVSRKLICMYHLACMFWPCWSFDLGEKAKDMFDLPCSGSYALCFCGRTATNSLLPNWMRFDWMINHVIFATSFKER